MKNGINHILAVAVYFFILAAILAGLMWLKTNFFAEIPEGAENITKPHVMRENIPEAVIAFAELNKHLNRSPR